IEWGDGIYGIEAAAERHFGVSASALDARTSALLAAVIINPRRFDPAHPDRRIERRARLILSRMWRPGFISEADYRVAIAARPPGAADTALAPPQGPVDTTRAGEPELPAPAAPDTGAIPPR